MKIKIISIISLVAILFSISALAISASVEILKPDDWQRRTIRTDQDFSFAFVGDTQTITYMDYENARDNDPYNDTAYVDGLFTWIADNAEPLKIKHVFTLGDLTDKSSVHDPELSYAAIDPIANGATYDAEFEIFKAAISKLDGIVPYSIVRGNHDGYQIDRFFNYEEYTKNFNGFYREDSGRYKDSITNSYRLAEINGIKFIFIALDFNPTRAVIAWLDELLTTYSDYNAIITMHAYAAYTGNKIGIANITHISGCIVQGKYNGAAPDWIWKNCLKKHSNVILTVSGHVGVDHPKAFTSQGDNGNKVLNVLVDPQGYDLNIQPIGAVLLMHFYDGGKTVKAEYYSTVLDAYKIGSNYTWGFDLMLPEATTDITTEATAETTTEATAAATTTATNTTTAVESTKTPDTQKNDSGCGAGISIVTIAIIPALFTLPAIRSKTKNKDT